MHNIFPYARMARVYMTMGHSKKDPYPTHRGNFHPLGGEGELPTDCFNLYRMSG